MVVYQILVYQRRCREGADHRARISGL